MVLVFDKERNDILIISYTSSLILQQELNKTERLLGKLSHDLMVKLLNLESRV